MEIRTDFELRKEQLWNRISKLYVEYKAEYPDARPTRIYTKIAQKFGMTAYGVRRICIKMGVSAPVHS